MQPLRHQQFKQNQDEIYALRKKLLESQQKLNGLMDRYRDVIQRQNLQHLIEKNAETITNQKKTIEGLREEIAKIPEKKEQKVPVKQDPVKQQQQQQPYQPQMSSMGGNIYPIPTKPAFSDEMKTLDAILKRDIQFAKFEPVFEGKLSQILPEINGRFNCQNHIIMWKTVEGFHCGFMMARGVYIAIHGNQQAYFFQRLDNKPLQIGTTKDGNGAIGLGLDNVMYIFDGYFYTNTNVNTTHYNPNKYNLFTLFTNQPVQQLPFVTNISKFFVLKIVG